MAKQTINIGSVANDGTGDPLRTAFNKVNQNFTELYTDIENLPTDISEFTDTSGLLFDGSYDNLTDKPTIATDVSDLNDAQHIISRRYEITRRNYTLRNISPSSLQPGDFIPQDINEEYVMNIKDTSSLVFHSEDNDGSGFSTLFENAKNRKQAFELYITDNDLSKSVFLTKDVDYISDANSYRGFKASFNNIFNSGKESISRIVIYEDTVNPTTSASNTAADDFTVSSLSGTGTIAIISLFNSTEDIIGRGQLWNFFKEFVDKVIYTNESINNIETAKVRFYDNVSDLKNTVPVLYPNFQFYANTAITANSSIITGGSGTGAAFSLLTGRYEGEIWRIESLLDGGSGYSVNDLLEISGPSLGGTNDNYMSIRILGVDGSGTITDYVVNSSSDPAINVWPTNSIENGGDGQYSIGNIINTNLGNNLNYNQGNRFPVSDLGNTLFGSSSSYNVLYKDSIFVVIAKNATVSSINFSGALGSDGNIEKSHGSLLGVKGYRVYVESLATEGTWYNQTGYEVSYSYAGYDVTRFSALTITRNDITNWNDAYSWGDHSTADYKLNRRSYVTFTGSTGIIDHDINPYKEFLHSSPASNWTVNVVGINLNEQSSTAITLTIDQGATPYLPTALRIDGSSKTINWQGGVAPTGTPNGVDVITFSILYSTGSIYYVQGWREGGSGGGGQGIQGIQGLQGIQGSGVNISSITGDIIPDTDSAYDLGSATNQWRSLYVSANTIFVGGTPISVDAGGNLLVDGAPVIRGTSLPYVELTNDPFITQAAIMGETVTVTAAPAGTNARYTVVIGEEGVIDSVTVTQAGSNYVVGQRYLILSFYIGGVNDDSGVIVVVDTVNESGGLLTVTIEGFFGPTHVNTPGTYTNASSDYLPSVFDEIDTGLTLTRDNQRALFNSESETEYDNNTYLSPLGTEWNADGWGNLVDLRSRSYTTFRSALNNQVGNNIVASELVMHDTINDKYYKFDFSSWGQSNAGGFAYTRNLITDPNFFEKEDYATGEEATDVFIEDDGEGGGIGITRGNNNSIYNPYREEEYDEDVSPAGTLWNIDGYDDLTDITTRTYQPFYAAYDGNLGNRVPGSKSIMYIPENGKYYAIEWLSWTQNNNGGGFSYIRREIDLTKVNEGVKFPDGTVLKTASGVGRVKSTASGERRIEEVSGSKSVSVTEIVTTNLTTVASRSVVNDDRFWVLNANTTIDDIINDTSEYGIYDDDTIEFSLDNTTWYQYDGGYSGTGTETGVRTNGLHTYNEGDTIYFRYKTGGEPAVWWNKADLPGGSANFRGAVIDYHAYSGEATWIGTIHIVDDSGEEHITHTEVMSGSTDGENDDLWRVQNEGTISYRRIDGEAKTLKVHWTAKVFYGSEYYD